MAQPQPAFPRMQPNFSSNADGLQGLSQTRDHRSLTNGNTSSTAIARRLCRVNFGLFTSFMLIGALLGVVIGSLAFGGDADLLGVGACAGLVIGAALGGVIGHFCLSWVENRHLRNAAVANPLAPGFGFTGGRLPGARDLHLLPVSDRRPQPHVADMRGQNWLRRHTVGSLNNSMPVRAGQHLLAMQQADLQQQNSFQQQALMHARAQGVSRQQFLQATGARVQDAQSAINLLQQHGLPAHGVAGQSPFPGHMVMPPASPQLLAQLAQRREAQNLDLAVQRSLQDQGGRPAQPASQSIVRALPTRVLNAEDIAGAPSEHKSCAICMDDFKAGDEERTLPCFHRFHSDCIDKWLSQSGVCPVCRVRVDGQED